MTDHVTTVAVQNVPLLQALKDGGAESPGALAEKAGVLANNLQRKLDSLEDDGLIARTPDQPRHCATLTQKGEAALAILSIRMVPAEQLIRWVDNPRSEQTLNDDELYGLARSIGDKGVLQPIIVRPKGDAFEVIAGDRRRRAARIAVEKGWRPADFLVPARVRELSDEEALEIAGVENIQRDDMHWMDEAKWFVRLSTRPHNPLSASAIERLIGGGRKKRSIQDYTKIARELSPEDIARCYLPDGHAQQLTYVKARDLVGEKKEKPALDLTPKLAMTLAELIDASDEYRSSVKEVTTLFYSPPAGGPIGTLADRKLITWKFVGGKPAAVIAITDEVRRWLEQTGYADNPDEALYKLRVAVKGELEASILKPGEYVTEELNAPTPSRVPTPAAPPPPPSVGDNPLQTYVLQPDAAPHTQPDRSELGDDELGPEPDLGDHAPPAAGEPEGRPAPTPPAPAADAFDLPPMLEIVALELAHKIAAAGIEIAGGKWAAKVRESYYKESRGAQGVQKFQAWQFLPKGRDDTLMLLQPRTVDWLAERFDLVAVGDGRLVLDDELLAVLQAQLGFKPDGAGPYSTYWLNPPAQPQPVLEPPPSDALEHGGRPDQPPRSFSDQLRELGAEARIAAMERMAAALREAKAHLNIAVSRRLKPDELAKIEALIDGALEAGKEPA